MSFKERVINLVLIYSLAAFFLFAFYSNFSILGEQQFTYLSMSFLKGKLYFLQNSKFLGDAAFYKEYFYWHEGPFPSFFLAPFVFFFGLFKIFFLQGYLQFFISLSIFYLCFKIAKKTGFKKIDCLFLAFAFCFASVYQLVFLIPWSWYFAQAIVVFFLFFAIFEFLNKKRYWIIGILFSLILMTRASAGLGILFFIAEIFFNNKYSTEQKIKNLGMTILPSLLLTAPILSFYNYFRFDNFFENGYMLSNNVLLNNVQRFELLNFGLFKLQNIPTNFYYYFLKTLDPVLVEFKSMWGNTHFLKPPFVTVNYPGTSFFVVSPIFIYIFRTKLKEKIVKFSIVSIIPILFTLLIYFGSGWRQVGPRYFLDFQPFLFLILLYSFKNFKLTLFSKLIILISSFFNFYLMLRVFQITPLL